MHILYDSTYLEICITNSIIEFREMGNIMLSFNNHAKLQSSDIKPNVDAYPVKVNFLDALILLRSENNSLEDLLQISISNGNLILTGNEVAMGNIGQSLLNFFDEDSQEGQHIHLNYYEGHFCTIAPTDCNLVFMYEEDSSCRIFEG
jgi:hypothetical protein